MQAPRGVDEHGIAPLRLRRADGVEHHRGGIGSFSGPNHIDAGASRPDLELLDGRGTEGIGRADQRLLAFMAQRIRQLADGGGLAGAVDADDEGDAWRSGHGDRIVHGSEDGEQFVLHQIAKAFACLRSLLHGRDDAVGGGNADIGRDQQFFERVDRVDINRTASPLGLVRPADDVVEAVDDLLLGPGEAFANAAEETHPVDLMRFRAPSAAGAA